MQAGYLRLCCCFFFPEITRALKSVNITQNGNAVFNCVASNADQISFWINDQAFADNRMESLLIQFE